MSRVLVVDNGAWEFKWGWSDEADSGAVPRCTPNCSVKTKATKSAPKRRLLLGHETSQLRESGTVFRRPCERGFVCDWGAQLRLWDSAQLPLSSSSSVLLLVPPRPPARLVHELAQVLFEETHVAAAATAAAPTVAAWCEGRGDALVVDAGYSHCVVQTVVDGRSGPVGRLDLGGKALTNYLKELVSYRQWNMMDETWLVNRIKERLAIVVPSLEQVLGPKGDRQGLTRSYVLPDFVSSTTGWVLEEDQPPPDAPTERQVVFNCSSLSLLCFVTLSLSLFQLLVLGPERAALGEALFRPSDLGLSQAGLGEGALGLIASLNPASRVSCPGRVIFAGGTSHLPGFCDRFMSELRAGLPDDVSCRRAAAHVPPRFAAWTGGAKFAQSPEYCPVTKEEYHEYGSTIFSQRFTPYL